MQSKHIVYIYTSVLSQDALPADLQLLIRNGTTAWSSPSRQNNIPPIRKARMNKPFGKAREESYIFQFDTSLWSHNVELFSRTLLVIFLSYFTPVLSQICTVRYPTILEQTRSTPCQRLKHNTVQNP